MYLLLSFKPNLCYITKLKYNVIRLGSKKLLSFDILQDSGEPTDIIPSVGSDHLPIKIRSCLLQQGLRGQSYWKFNTLLNKGRSFAESLKKKISNFRTDANNIDDIATRWEYMRYYCRI